MKSKCCLWLHKYGRQKDGVGTCPVKLRLHLMCLKLTNIQSQDRSSKNNSRANIRSYLPI